MFYLWACILLLLGAGLVLLALRRRKPGIAAAAREATVAALYRDRLDELRREMISGQADPNDREVLEAELSAALLSDYQAADRQAVAAASSPAVAARDGGAMLGMVSAALLVALALLVYNVVGDPLAMQLAGAESTLQMDPAQDKAALSEWRDRLVQRVDRRSADAKSWYLLGHVDLKLGQFGTAAEAFARAHEVLGDDPSVDLFWLQARYMAAGGQIDGTSRTIADRILARDPNQPLVLEMYAIDAFRQGDYRQSVTLLNRALSGNLEGRHRTALTAGFQEARSQLGDLPPALDVEIVAPAEVPSGRTLFVIARPVGGGMPFAVVRRPADEFPRTIRLDDAVSMNPAAPLSSAPQVEVVVRLSQAGTAMAHPGDWEWQSGPLTLTGLTTPVQLTAELAPPG